MRNLILKVEGYQVKFLRFTLHGTRITHPAAMLMLCAAFFLLALFLAQPAFAQTPDPVTDDDVNAVARDVYCPVCENVPLDVCPTKACADWREEIRLMLIEGKTEAEIEQYFVDRFGDRVVGAPPRRGLNWLVYVVPPVAVLGGIFLVYRVFQTRKKPLAASAAATASLADDDYVRKLEAELKQRDR